MSNTEDYLDSLLNNINSVNMTGKGQASKTETLSEAQSDEIIRRYKQEQQYQREKEQKEEEERRREQEFLDSFEEELADEEADDFLHQFELEIEADKSDAENGQEKSPDFFENIEGIIEGASAKPESAQEGTLQPEALKGELKEERLTKGETEYLSEVLGPEMPLEQIVSDEAREDVLGEHSETEQERIIIKEPEEDGIVPESENGEDAQEPENGKDTQEPENGEDTQEPEYATEEPMGQGETGDEDLLDLLSNMQDDEDISEIGDLLKADQNHIELEESGIQDEMSEQTAVESTADGQDEQETANKDSKKKHPKKKGIFSKVASLLLGEDEAEEKEDVTVPEMGDLENISEENLEILKSLELAEQEQAKQQEEKDEKKKSRKKAKKEKKPKEKKVKKPKKEKKPKAPKEKDNTPPLPKKPMFLIFVMAASILVLILLASSGLGYSSNIRAAKNAMDNANYTEAYQELSGLELKKADKKLYAKAETMAAVQAEHDAYLTLMASENYEMALDALVRGIGRYDANLAAAKKYGMEKQLNVIKNEIEDALDTQFDLVIEDARNLYAIKDRKEYSEKIHEIVQDLKLGQVEE